LRGYYWGEESPSPLPLALDPGLAFLACLITDSNLRDEGSHCSFVYYFHNQAKGTKVDHASRRQKERSQAARTGGPPPGTCEEGQVSTARGDHPDGEDDPVKMIGPGSGWKKEGDYRRTLGFHVALFL
jgi:hypothetical protein